MSNPLTYEVVVIGGGPAGLTTALYTTRLGHRTAVFEREGGRHTAVSSVHNLVGVSEDVSGAQLAELGARQLEEYGGDVFPDAVQQVERLGDADNGRDAGEASDEDAGGSEGVEENGSATETSRADIEGRFLVSGVHATVAAERVVFATGFTDESPDVPDLETFAGRGLHYCLHCDAYTLGDESVFVMGHNDDAAEVAMLMLNYTDDVDLLLDGRAPEWSDETERTLRAHPVDRVTTAVISAFPEDEDAAEPWLGGLTFADGNEREYLGGFAMYGKEFNTRLADALGCDATDEGGIAVDESGETSVDGAYAVGDVTHGQNQTTVAIGDGARAGIALHKDLRTFPLSPDEIDEGTEPEDLDIPASTADLRARMRRDRKRETHVGLRDAPLDR